MPVCNSSEFDPPAPTAQVSFVNPETGQRIDSVPMLLDTGADVAVIPQTLARSLNATERSTAYEIGYLESDAGTLPSVRLEMRWLDRSFTGESWLPKPHTG